MDWNQHFVFGAPKKRGFVKTTSLICLPKILRFLFVYWVFAANAVNSLLNWRPIGYFDLNVILISWYFSIQPVISNTIYIKILLAVVYVEYVESSLFKTTPFRLHILFLITYQYKWKVVCKSKHVLIVSKSNQYSKFPQHSF